MASGGPNMFSGNFEEKSETRSKFINPTNALMLKVVEEDGCRRLIMLPKSSDLSLQNVTSGNIWNVKQA